MRTKADVLHACKLFNKTTCRLGARCAEEQPITWALQEPHRPAEPSLSVCRSAEAVPEHWARPVRFGPANFTSLLSKQWRYFTVVPCGISAEPSVLCLVFSVNAVGHWSAGLQSFDSGRSFESGASIVAPFHFWSGGTPVLSMSHNLALLRHGNEYVIAGGMHARNTSWHKGSGIWLAHGTSWRFSPGTGADARTTFTPPYAPKLDGFINEGTETQWRDLRLAIDGFHSGCFEGRRFDAQLAQRREKGEWRSACEFDGRLTLVHMTGRFFLFVRLNPTPSGHRFVQVTSSPDLHTWSRFSRLVVEGYTPDEQRADHGNIYFWSASVNPLHNKTMMALMPVSHHRQGCVGISLSTDGRHWSPITPVVHTELDTAPCEPEERARGACFDGKYVGHRTTHHPVTGAVLVGGHVVFFIHENVPEIIDHAPKPVRRPPRLMRYAVPAPAFSRWTTCSIAWLRYGVRVRHQAEQQLRAPLTQRPEPCSLAPDPHATRRETPEEARSKGKGARS